MWIIKTSTDDDVEMSAAVKWTSIAVPLDRRQRLRRASRLAEEQVGLAAHRRRLRRVASVPLRTVETHLRSFDVPRIIWTRRQSQILHTRARHRGAAVGRWICDLQVAGSIPTGPLSRNIGQLSLASLRGR